MFDVGFWELLVMAVIGLLVLGPERLPRAARQLGRWLSAARRTASQLRWQIEREIDLGDQQRRQPSASGQNASADRAAASSASGAESAAGPTEARDTAPSPEQSERAAEAGPAEPEPAADPEPSTADQRPADGMPRDREG